MVATHLCVVHNENVSRLSLQSSTCLTSLWLKGKNIILETKLNSLEFLNVALSGCGKHCRACFTLKRNCFGQVLPISLWFALLKRFSVWKCTCLQQNSCSLSMTLKVIYQTHLPTSLPAEGLQAAGVHARHSHQDSGFPVLPLQHYTVQNPVFWKYWLCCNYGEFLGSFWKQMHAIISAIVFWPCELTLKYWCAFVCTQPT